MENLRRQHRLKDRIRKADGLITRLSGYRISAALLAFLLSVFVYLFSKEPIYLKNDYGYILNTLSGGLTGQPFHNTIYVSPALGSVVSWLYAHVGGTIPWLSILCYSLYLIALYLLIRVLLKHIKNNWLKLLYFILITIFFQAFGTFLNNAIISLVLYIGALIYLIFAAVYDEKISWIKLALFGFLMAIAYMFRPSFWNFMLVFMLPLITVLMLRRRLGYMLVLIAAFLLLFVPDAAVSAKLNAGYDHQAFLDYNRARTDLMDSNKGKLEGDALTRGLDAAGWSDNDYQMLLNWQLVDETVFDAQSCQAFMDSGDRHYIHLNGLKDIYRSPEPKFFLSLCFGAFLLALFTKSKNDPVIHLKNEKRYWLFVLLPLYYLGGVILLFAIRFNVNMLFGMFLLVFFTIPLALSILNRDGLRICRPKKRGRKTAQRMIWAGIGVAIIFFLFVFNRYVLTGHSNNTGKMRYYFGRPFPTAERYNAQIEFLDSYYDEPYIILPSSVMSDFPMVYTCLPFLEYEDFKQSVWVPVAWRAQSEHFYKILDAYGYASGSRLLMSLASGDTSIVIFSAGSDEKIAAEKEMLYTFLSEHYGDILASSGADFAVIYKDANAELSVLADSDYDLE